MAYFLLIALLPVLFLTLFYYTSVSRTVNEHLSSQADAALSGIISRFGTCLEDYRHRSYEIAGNEVIHDVLTNSGTYTSRELYQQLYLTMRGTIYDASAHLVSIDGRRQFSTHEFPSIYDIRYHSNDESIAAVLDRLDSEPVLLLNERYANNRNDIIMLNMVRAVRNASDRTIGYAIIDIFSSTLSDLCEEPIFSDIILIDMETLSASSLLQTDLHGDYSLFPALIEEASPSSFESVRISPDHIIAQARIPGTNLAVAGTIEISAYTDVLDRISLLSMVIIGISIIAALLLAYISSNHITRPISSLVRAMKQVEQGELDTSVTIPAKSEEIRTLTEGFNAMVSQIRELIDLTKEEEQQLREAERKALQAQIDPHFLYNTLNTIRSLASLHGEKQILQISSALGKLLRSSISSSSDTLPLSRSLELVGSYLTIVQVRFPERLHFRITADPALSGFITPKLIIQPFVENAVTHGLEPKLGTWSIRVYVYRFRGYAAVSIIDDGIGFETASLAGLNGDHIGIMNVRRRLELFYQGEADITITSREQVGTVVRILIPYRE